MVDLYREEGEGELIKDVTGRGDDGWRCELEVVEESH